ncbi:MAG: hypothetical protein ABIO55_02865 [Ginsengibacter sp.]
MEECRVTPAPGSGISAVQLESLNNGSGGIPGIPSSFMRGSNGEISTSPKAYIHPKPCLYS